MTNDTTPAPIGADAEPAAFDRRLAAEQPAGCVGDTGRGWMAHAAITDAAQPDPRTPANMRVNGGALILALNVLRCSGKNEVADELEKTAAPSAQQGETNAQLDTDSNSSAPGQQRDVDGTVALGQPVGHGSDSTAGDPSAQGDKLLIVAERNIRSFLRSATFKSESDREAALNCVDVLSAALASAAQSADQRSAMDSERLDWLAAQTRSSRTGISFDWCAHVEDGQVLEKGYRFMRRAFLGARHGDFRAAIDAARGAQGENNTT